MTAPPVLFTAGYEGRTLAEFLADLSANGVRLLADIREAPISRKRGFSKAALSQALAEAGIGYRHIRALGCPKAIRDAHREDGDWDRYTRGFMTHLSGQQPALEELAPLTLAEPTALLCYEADFNRCHRSYVARALAARTGATIRHITTAGLAEDPGTVR